MSSLYERLDRCNHAIQMAALESKRLHTEAERAGLLTCEMDERSRRESILVEIATQGRTIWEHRSYLSALTSVSVFESPEQDF